MPRQPNGRPAINKRADGKYHCDVTVGTKPNGTPDRRHIKRTTSAEVIAAIAELQQRVDATGGAPPGKIELVTDWLLHWLEHEVRPNKPQSTYRSYRSMLTTHAIPAIGARRLDGPRNRLEPEHVTAMFARMRRAGLEKSTVLKMFRVLDKALGDAKRQGKTSRNVCDLIETPKGGGKKIDSYDLDDAQALLDAAADDTMEARWLIGVLLGPRQGEALGIRWPQVKLAGKKPRIRLLKQIQRYTWEHGCADPVACAAPHCRTAPCGPSWAHGCADPATACKQNPRWCPARTPTKCRRHSRPCPRPCEAGCTRHAMHCPNRKGGGLVEVDLKSTGSERDLPLGELVVAALHRRQAAQMTECFDRGVSWDPEGLVFTTAGGAPIDPQRDRAAWRALGARAGVPAKRLHAARHTALSLLVGDGADADISVAQEIGGHADVRTTRGYVDVLEKAKRKAVERMEKKLLRGKKKRSQQR